MFSLRSSEGDVIWTAITILSLLAFGLAFTVRRVWVLVLFYIIYGVPKIVAMSDLLDPKALLVFRVLYAVLAVSFIARFLQDEELVQRLRRFPLISYGFLVATVILSICYTMVSTEKANIWGYLSLLSLFPLAALQMQRDEDFKVMAGATVLVSLALSTWVISLSYSTDFAFEARGGTDINQNFLSVWLLLGAFPLVQLLFTGKTKKTRLLAILLLTVVCFGAFLLASRGMLIAFVAGLVSMAPMMVSRIGLRRSFILGIVLLMVVAGSLLLPGAQGAVHRFAQADTTSLNNRTLVWSTAATDLEDSGAERWILGNGMASGLRVLNTLTKDQWNYHNEYLGRLMDEGVLGLGAFVLLLAILWRITRKSRHSSKPVMIAWVAFFTVAGLSSTIADSHPFWIVLGTITGACLLAHPQQVKNKLPWPSIWHAAPEPVARDAGMLLAPAQPCIKDKRPKFHVWREFLKMCAARNDLAAKQMKR